MQTPFLYGEFEQTLDGKGRLSIPSEIRRQFSTEDGDAFFVTMKEKVPWLYLEKYYQRLLALQFPAQITPDPKLLRFTHLTMSLSQRVEWDASGRIVLPEKFVKRAELGRDVTLIGARDHLEVWNRQDWDLQRETLYKQTAEIESGATEVLEKLVQKVNGHSRVSDNQPLEQKSDRPGHEPPSSGLTDRI
jgi:MraZ protein